MNKNLLALGLIILSIASFFVWINPHYANVKSLQSALSDSNSALSQAQDLDAKRLALTEKENAFDPADLAKLQTLLPDHVDSVRFIIDMQGIAAHYGLSMQDIKIGSDASGSASSAAAPIGPNNDQSGQTPLAFTVSTTYQNLIAFLQDIEKSLRLVEVKSISFSADNAHPNLYTVSMTVNAFWLNQTPTSVTSS